MVWCELVRVREVVWVGKVVTSVEYRYKGVISSMGHLAESKMAVSSMV